MFTDQSDIYRDELMYRIHEFSICWCRCVEVHVEEANRRGHSSMSLMEWGNCGTHRWSRRELAWILDMVNGNFGRL